MKNLLSSSSFLIVNKKLARTIGLKETILLADLISKEEYFIETSQINKGWFFNTENNIEQDTTLTRYQQRKCLKTLVKHKIIEVKRKGIPAKLYFKINEQQVVQFLNNLKSIKSTTINNNKEIRINNNSFKKPTVDDINLYCSESNNKIDAEAFYDFYESKNWYVGKNKMKDWKAAVRNWRRRDKKKPNTMSKIDSQLNEYLKGKEYL
tara:strand:+ start:3129 stop:3752 length:624 start_codon:yes stop_codon:yes gene_type:complete